MKKALVLAMTVSLAGAACHRNAQVATVDFKTEEQKTLYALGLALSDNIAPFNLSESDLDFVKAGLSDGALHRTRQVDLAVYGPKLRDLAQSRHYRGTLVDGTVFDSSIDRGQPAVFPLANVIPCWSQGVQLMKVGGKSRLVCPPELAYGDRGAPPQIKPGATLVFEVELLDIVKK